MKNLNKTTKSKEGICLNIGAGESNMSGFVNLDKRRLKGVDIVHDLEVIPYPLKKDSCITIVGSHIWEHLKPWLTVDIMNELWRIMKPGGRLALSMPYGVNELFQQDPTHINSSNQATWQYFDPAFPLWLVYKPKPWKVVPGFPVYQVTGLMEVVMEKVSDGIPK